MVITPLCPVVSLHIRCGTAQNYHGITEFSQFNCHISGMISRRLIRLFICPLMLFINNNQPQVWLRCKKGATRTNNYVTATFFYPVPLIKLLTQGQPTVNDSDTTREPRGKALYRLR